MNPPYEFYIGHRRRVERAAKLNAAALIATTKNSKKYIFCITYKTAEKAALLLELEKLDIEILAQSNSGSSITVKVDMAQFTTLKSLNCIMRSITLNLSVSMARVRS